MDMNELTLNLKKQKSSRLKSDKEDRRDDSSIEGSNRLQKALVETSRVNLSHREKTIISTREVNPLKSISTPDTKETTHAVNLNTKEVRGVIKGIDSLAKKIEKLPTEFPNIPEVKIPSYPSEIKTPDTTKAVEKMSRVLVKELKNKQPLKISVNAPEIKVTPAIRVDVDTKEFTQASKDLLRAIQNLRLEVPAQDNSEVSTLLSSVITAVESLVFPVATPSPGFNKTVNLVQSVDFPDIWGIPVLNPDGTMLSVGGGTAPATGYGTAIYGTKVYD